MPSLLRRRVTPLGRTALGTAWSIPNAEDARYIYSSRHGEFDRTLSLMNALVREEELSPADFTLSVHHALIGLLSIAQQNKRGHTAIAAGADSFCHGLIEAAACIAENPDEPVIFIHCDDVLPTPYDAFATKEEQPVAVVLALTESKKDTGIRITQKWTDEAQAQADNHAVSFLNFLRSDAISCDARGQEWLWHWERHALA